VIGRHDAVVVIDCRSLISRRRSGGRLFLRRVLLQHGLVVQTTERRGVLILVISLPSFCLPSSRIILCITSKPRRQMIEKQLQQH